MTLYVYDDGGRAAAGFKGSAGDCVTRAFTIAQFGPQPSGRQYRFVYDHISDLIKEWAWEGRISKAKAPYRKGRTMTGRNSTPNEVCRRYGADIGWLWTPTMGIGTGTTVHLRADELPTGTLVAACSRHYVAVIDGVIYDTYEDSRDGKRAVYGFYQAKL